MITITPNEDRIVVEPVIIKNTERKAGSLYLPQQVDNKAYQGKVLAIGSAIKNVEVGQTVIFSKFSGIPYTIDDKPILFLHQSEILLSTNSEDITVDNEGG